ncbi:sigma-54 dependent transcriptional regulator [Gammaproteobacteria bacterium]|nr:sigma-54 dependent transcriptional regulator [Gammaproteobacteria bacterium]
MKDSPEKMNEQEDDAHSYVLLVEDDEFMRLSLADRLHLEKISFRAVCNIADACGQLENGDIDLVVTDIRLPDGSGADLFRYVTQRFPGTPVILMTAYGDVADAVSLVKAGAVDYLTKPFDIVEFIDKLRRQLSHVADARLFTGAPGTSSTTIKPGSGFLGKSLSMRKIERLITRLYESDSSVLITGESGVGKEVIASMIHNNSSRRSGPMIRVNCAALSPGLVESELFGHEKGSFTGAIKRRTGRFEQAQGGTIFLDEIAEVSQDIQVKLLRVLQERVIERVGGQEPIPLDVRVVVATQVDLESAIERGEFRSDLYWRINVIRIDVPPLHDRKEDVIYLARKFVKELAEKAESPVNGMTKEAESLLLSMAFHGNVRELKNTIERAVALSTGPLIGADDLAPPGAAKRPGYQEQRTATLKQSIETAERLAIVKALSDSNRVINRAADKLGISRKSLWEKMKRHGIER